MIELVPKTGWPFPVLMQDDDRKLSKWRSNTPHARALSEEAAQEIKEENDGKK